MYKPGLFTVAIVLLFQLPLTTNAEATRFAPSAISMDGRLTLTPTFTPDGKTAYFAQSQCADIGPCPQTLHVSRLSQTGWSRSEPVALPASGRVDWPSVSPDGRYLFFSWSASRTRYEGLDLYEDFDIYRLDLSQSDAIPVALDTADINRPRAGSIRQRAYFHNSTSPVQTANGDLYFWSERIDAIGERDIFYAPTDGDGNWLIARPLSAPINSKGRDNHAWVSPAGGLMLISYPDRGGEGDEDIFVSRKVGGQWSEPINLGAEINSPYADFAPKLSPDGAFIVFTSSRPYQDSSGNPTLQVWSVDTQTLIDAGTLMIEDLSR